MCGIFCLLDKRGRSVSLNILESATDTLAHRGPDHRATMVHNNVGLGFRRLSIVDEAHGDQPLSNESGSVSLICNGEIYNYRELRAELEQRGHRFRTGSDCEVVVHLYEEDAQRYIERLDGMFAFVLLDRERDLVQLGRDRLGIKPLEIFENPDFLMAASEIKAILATGIPERRFNHQALKDSLIFNYPPGSETVFAGITHLAPASIMQVPLSGGAPAIREYWSLSFPNAKNEIPSVGHWTRSLQEVFRLSVKSHTIGDRDVAAYLSGGIDSTVTTLVLKQFFSDPSRLSVFSIAFPDSDCDESDVFRQTARENKLDLRIYESRTLDASDFQRALVSIEQPQTSPMDVPLHELSRLVRASGLKVVLSGEGSDELLGGYSFYTLNQIRRVFEIPALSGIRDSVLPLVLRYYLDAQELPLFSELYGNSAPIIGRFGTFPAWFPVWTQRARQFSPLFREPLRDSLGEGSAMQRVAQPIKRQLADVDDFNKNLWLEMKTRLPNYILQRTDRNAMANSVEARVPYLSNKMIDLTAQIPPLLKMFGLKEKFILRRAFGSILPKQVRKRTKFGYRAPVERLWEGKDELRDWALSPEYLEATKVFSPSAVAELKARINIGTSTPESKMAREALTGVLSVQLLHASLLDGRPRPANG